MANYVLEATHDSMAGKTTDVFIIKNEPSPQSAIRALDDAVGPNDKIKKKEERIYVAKGVTYTVFRLPKMKDISKEHKIGSYNNYL